VIVTVAHPAGNVAATLRQWIETGPGPCVRIVAARWRNGDPIPLEAVPLAGSVSFASGSPAFPQWLQILL
jgi:hypothetical protein